MNNVWFTSDLHLWHQKVAETRGFMDPLDHDNAVMYELHATVKPGDQLWILGDLSAGSGGSERYALDQLAQLDAELHLIAGNHDRCHPMHRDAHKHQRRFLEVFTSVQPFARRRIAGQQVLLSHYPYEGDHTVVDRDTQYRLRDEGLWLLHGHTHSIHFCSPRPRQIHVGWDAWRGPVPLDKLAQHIERLQ